jgi:LacI family transcriptional regulator
MPVVLVDSRIDDKSMCAISVDHVLGGYLATKHLLELGHRNIVYLTGPLHLAPCASVVQGYRQAMEEAGVPAEKHSVVVTQGTGLADGLTGTLEVFERYPQATAMASVSDLMAVGAFSAARQEGVRIPSDFSVVGYDDVPLSAAMSPSLTTIAQDKWMLGTIAVNLLMEEIRSEDHKHCQVILPPSLVVRESTARPAT